ncbi:MAG: adenine phosphoribosyltransferase [Bacilli bacterium]|jgi:adenine phosphoribosyltransferase|nr:adenine phosphoribosyltransferase [Bacilli bacterium]
MNYEKYIGVTPDFPKKGISFKDISPLLRDPAAFHSCVDDLTKLCSEFKPDMLIGPESRSFLFGAAVAYKMGIGFVMARKAGKLPGAVYRISYDLEYGTATLEIPKDSFKPGMRVLLIDDLLATGGTFNALKQLVVNAGGTPVATVVVIRLKELKGEENIGLPCRYLLNL